jgi:hypothetical protein
LSWFTLLVVVLLIGIVLALPVFPWRFAISRSPIKRQITLLLFSLMSFFLGFFLMANLMAQASIIFTCWADGYEPCARYAEQAGLSTSDEFENLAATEMLWRNLIPPLLQKDCFIAETNVCDILALPEWQNDVSSAFWFNFFIGLLSSGVTAVSILFFTRNRANAGQSTR